MYSNICRINFKKSIVLNKVHDKQRNLRKYCKGPNVHVCALYIYTVTWDMNTTLLISTYKF